MVSLAIVGLLGLLHLPTAFSGDAALYQWGARTMHAGGALYRDHWDLKSPGIYAFHWVAGVLFGFHEEGVHALEWLLLFALGVSQSLLLARLIRPSALAALAPLVSIGTFYASATAWHLTQPAVLLGVPLYVLLALIGSEKASARKWLVAGVAGALAVSVKPYALGIVLSLGGTGLWIRTRIAAETPGALLRTRVGPFILGLVGTLAMVAVALAVAGGLEAFVDAHGAWREAAALVRGPFPLARAFGGAETFIRTFAPWLLLTLVGWLRWRTLSVERYFVLSAVWMLSGTMMTIIEPFAGWEFDFLVLMVPTGLLAVRAVHGLLDVLTSVRRASAGRHSALALAIAVLIVLLTGGQPLVDRARLWFRHVPLGQAAGERLRTVHDRRASRLWNESAPLRAPSSRSGAVYVFGDPLRQLYANRPTASPIHGWAWELQPSHMWERVARDLDATPAAYIYVSREYEGLITERAPAVRRLLAERYHPYVDFTDGRWYARAD